MAHQLPPFPQSVRFATPADIERLAIIAFAGGLQTDEFKYQSPYAHTYPEDTLDAWRYQLAGALRSDHYTIIVVEDTANPDEDELTPGAVPMRYGTLGVGRCVVGFARLKLKPNYLNERVFQSFHIGNWSSVGRKRDQHIDNSMEYSIRVACESSRRLVDTQLSLETLTIHPAYHRRGHGKKLVNWMLDLARLDNAIVGIAATRLGVPLYRSLNFERVYSFEVAAGIPVQLMRYDPGSGAKYQHIDVNSHRDVATIPGSDRDLTEICDNLSLLSL